MAFRGSLRPPGPRGPRIPPQNSRQRMPSLMGPPGAGMMPGAPPMSGMPPIMHGPIPPHHPGPPPSHHPGPPPPHPPGPPPPHHPGPPPQHHPGPPPQHHPGPPPSIHGGPPPVVGHGGPPPQRIGMPPPMPGGPIPGGPMPMPGGPPIRHGPPPPPQPYGVPPPSNRPGNPAMASLVQNMRGLPRFGPRGPPGPPGSQWGTPPPPPPPPMGGNIVPVLPGPRPNILPVSGSYPPQAVAVPERPPPQQTLTGHPPHRPPGTAQGTKANSDGNAFYSGPPVSSAFGLPHFPESTLAPPAAGGYREGTDTSREFSRDADQRGGNFRQSRRGTHGDRTPERAQKRGSDRSLDRDNAADGHSKGEAQNRSRSRDRGGGHGRGSRITSEDGRRSSGYKRGRSPSPADRRNEADRDTARRHDVSRDRDRRRDRRWRSRGERDRESDRRAHHWSGSEKRGQSPNKDVPPVKRSQSSSRSRSRRRSPETGSAPSAKVKDADRPGDRGDRRSDVGRAGDAETKNAERPAERRGNEDRARSGSRRASPEHRRRRDRRRESRKPKTRAADAASSAQAQSEPADDNVTEAPASPPSWEQMSAQSRYEVLSSLLAQEKSPVQSEKEKQENNEKTEESTPVPAWIRCSPADLYFRRDRETNCMAATKKMEDLEDRFEEELIKRSEKVRSTKPPYEKPIRPNPALAKHSHKHHHSDGSAASSSSSSEDDDSDIDNEVAHCWMEELTRKQQHPERLHSELWFNEPGEMNDGPLCRCSLKSKESGIRHDIYPGESSLPRCLPSSNNQTTLYHYRITMSPHTNFLTKNPTIIEYDNHEYIFEGFSLLSHYKLENVPVCRVIRFNIEYTIHWFEEDIPENFSLRSLELFNDYLFYEFLELVDLDWKPKSSSCSRFHLMPRFARDLPDNGKEVLSMNEVLLYLLRSARPLMEETELADLLRYEKHEWQTWVDKVRGMIVTYPGMRPSSIRIDQLDREQQKEEQLTYPMIIHFGIRPAQLSYAGDPNYQKLWKQYVKFKHLLANKPKITLEDKTKLERKEEQLQEMRMKSTMKREVTVELSAKGFIKTGIKSDMCQHAMLLPVLIVHLRFHKCLDELEESIAYRFKDRMLLQLALTHPSYRVNFGTNPDHARNSLSNCGIRQPEYGDRRIHHVHTRKRGINTLINIMSRLGRKEETVSEINHYERLEFLGDAVVEFMSSIHLYYMFPSLEEGGLATYRAAIVQNQHLAVLAKKLHLHDYMLYAHGPDLCHESDLRHAMANCLEALMGALFLDGGIELSDRIFGEVLFDDDGDLLYTWQHIPVHPLQEDEPNGDRHWISSSPALQKLRKFEDMTGTEFNHIRLLARAFTMRNVGYNNLTFGHNQRLEFLGDTVLQLVASEYLFKHFPEHHEGHLSLLRSSLVNNRTQAVVCDDLGMTEYIIHSDNRPYDQTGMKHKEKADLLEAFIGGLYVDKDLEFCSVFCHVCFFPRLKQFILNQDWNDPKSQLQQCCLTLRELDGGEPDIPIYKVIASTGPTNTRKYTVAVYFRGERLATGSGHSIQQAEMNAATNALSDRGELFPQLAHQKKFIEKKYKRRRRRSKPETDL